MNEEDRTRFLNVDLEVVARVPLGRLVKRLGAGVFVHRVGTDAGHHVANLSLSSYRRTAESVIRSLVRRIESLGPAERRVWDGALSRELNVGIQAGLSPHHHELRIGSKAVAAVVRIGASIVITTYAPAMHPTEARRILAEKASRRTRG